MAEIEAEVLERLRWKYTEMLRLRAQRDAAAAKGEQAFGGEAAIQRKADFRRLSAEFPGALREMEWLSIEALAARKADVDRALEGEVAGWIEVCAGYHALMRQALGWKAWKAGRGERPPSMAPGFEALCADPPEGRLEQAAWSWLAQQLGRDAQALRREVFAS